VPNPNALSPPNLIDPDGPLTIIDIEKCQYCEAPLLEKPRTYQYNIRDRDCLRVKNLTVQLTRYSVGVFVLPTRILCFVEPALHIVHVVGAVVKDDS
jgi:hypothetical protein